MAEARNRMLVRRLLKKIRKDDRAVAIPVSPVSMKDYKRAYRTSLKGTNEARTVCIKKANDYLAQLKIATESKRVIPSSLHPVIAELRKVAGSIRLSCTARMQAVEKLLFLEGFPVPQTNDATWQLIHRELGTTPPSPPPLVAQSEQPERAPKWVSRPKLAELRLMNRRRALIHIRECFRADREAGIITTLSEVERALRLPEMPPVVKDDSAVEDVHKETLDKALELIGRM